MRVNSPATLASFPRTTDSARNALNITRPFAPRKRKPGEAPPLTRDFMRKSNKYTPGDGDPFVYNGRG